VTEGDAETEVTVRLDEGARFGRYEVLRWLGGGGFGDVYESLHRELGKRVALKVLRREYALHPTVRARFTREAQAAARLRHVNVVDVTDVGVFEGQPYLVMELLEGETLRACCEREGPLPPARAVDLLLPVLDAVAAAHAQGLVHRDLKPENIFLAQQGISGVVPKVLDFGVVKLDDEGARPAMLTGSGVLLGTPSYMSPEQARDVRDLDGRSDQFSLGAVLYECLCGRRAFEGDGMLGTLQLVASAAPAPLPDDVPDALRAVVLRALEKSPEARFPSVQAFAEALLPFASPAMRERWSVTARAPAPPAPSVVPPTPSGPRTLRGQERPAPGPQAPPTRPVAPWVVAAVAVAGAAVALSRGAVRPAVREQPPRAEVVIPPAESVRAVAPVPPPETPSPAPPPTPAVVPAPAPMAVRALRRRARVVDAGVPTRRLGANGAVIED
jgi:serine/threonine protein kinase